MDSFVLLNRLKDLLNTVAGIKKSIESNPDNEDLRDEIDIIDKAIKKVMKRIAKRLKDEVDLL